MKQAEKANGAGGGAAQPPLFQLQSLEEFLVSFQLLYFTKGQVTCSKSQSE